MKSYIKYILLFLLLIPLISCEKESAEAKALAYNIALLTTDCNYLENYYAELDASNKQYSVEEAYFYASTISNCSNFNTIALVTTSSSDIYEILSAYLSKQYLTQIDIENINNSQDRILNLCNTYMKEPVEEGDNSSKYLDTRAEILCSLTSVTSSTLETIQATSFLSNSKIIPISKQGLSDSVADLIKDGAFKDKASIIKSIENFFDIKAGEIGDNKTKEDAMQEVAEKILSVKDSSAFKEIAGESVSEDIEKYVEEITIEKDGKRVVTSESLADYLEKILK